MAARLVPEWGSICTLMWLLRHYEWAIEGDLSFYHHRRYTDRWRFDADGRRLLTVREIWNLIRANPTTSTLATALNGGRRVMSETEVLIADLYSVMAGRLHPHHPAALQLAAEAAAEEQRIEALRVERVAEKRAREAQQRGEVIDGGR